MKLPVFCSQRIRGLGAYFGLGDILGFRMAHTMARVQSSRWQIQQKLEANWLGTNWYHGVCSRKEVTQSSNGMSCDEGF